MRYSWRMQINAEIKEELWSDALRWGRTVGVPEHELAAALIHQAIHAAHPIPLGQPEKWMLRSRTGRSASPRLAVGILNGPNWDRINDRIKRVAGAARLPGASPRAWYSMDMAQLGAIRTLLSDVPDRVRLCVLPPNGS